MLRIFLSLISFMFITSAWVDFINSSNNMGIFKSMKTPSVSIIRVLWRSGIPISLIRSLLFLYHHHKAKCLPKSSALYTNILITKRYFQWDHQSLSFFTEIQISGFMKLSKKFVCMQKHIIEAIFLKNSFAVDIMRS